MPSAEIIAIGTELLLGETADTNTRFIARTLRGLGVDLFRTHTIGDNAARIAQSVRDALSRTDIVITTGGLGPTVDDPTRQAIANAVGSELEFHPELWEQIVARIGAYGRTPTENQKRQAFIPSGAIVIENPVGTAPAFIVEVPPGTSPNGTEVRGGTIITLPGVPREMETLLNDAVIPYLQKRYDLNEIIKVRTLHVSGLGEGMIDDKIEDLETLVNPTVGLTAHSGIVDIRIAAKAATEPEADGMIAKVEADLRSRLGDNIYGSDDDTLEAVALEAAAQQGWTLTVLESGLEGALSLRLKAVAHPNFRPAEQMEVPPGRLDELAEKTMLAAGATAVLAVSLLVSSAGQAIDMVLITPAGKETRSLTYGGHPKNAARWAVNNSLDWLRRSAMRIG